MEHMLHGDDVWTDMGHRPSWLFVEASSDISSECMCSSGATQPQLCTRSSVCADRMPPTVRAYHGRCRTWRHVCTRSLLSPLLGWDYSCMIGTL